MRIHRQTIVCLQCGCVFGITYNRDATPAVRTALAEARHRRVSGGQCEGDQRSLHLLTDRPAHEGERELAA